MGNRLQSNQFHKLGGIQSTSAQLSLTLALICYGSIFGVLTRKSFFNASDPDQIDHDKLQTFLKRLKIILSHLLSQESRDILLSSYENNNHSISKKIKNYNQKSQFPLKGKLKYFDKEHKVILSQRGIDELSYFLSSLDIQDAQDVHYINEYNPRNSAPLSGRRLAASSSLMSTVGTLWAFAVILNEDNLLDAQHMDFSSIAALEGATSISISALFTIFIMAKLLKLDRENRTNNIAAEYRAACVHTLISLQDQQNALQLSVKGSEVAYHDDTADSEYIFCDSPTPTMSPLCTQPAADNESQQKQQAYMPLAQEDHYSALTQENWPLDIALNNINNTMNVAILKGAISAEAGRIRSNRTLLPAIVISAVCLGIDIATSGVSLGIRIGLGVLMATTASAARYEAKRQEVQKKLYAKVHRHSLNSTLQKRFLSELTVYGLQPADTYETPPLLSSTHVNIKRQVEVDVAKFIQTLKIQNTQNEFSILPAENNTNITDEFRYETKSKEKLLEKLAIYARKHAPQSYCQQNTYFTQEFVFQMREQYLQEDPQIIQSEREDCFCRPAAKLTAQYDNMSIQRLHKEIMIYESQQSSEKDKQLSEKISVPDDHAVLKQLNSDLNWNPWLATIRPQQKRHEMVVQKNSSSDEEEQHVMIQEKTPQQVLETNVRKKLSWSMGYAYYAATQFGILPWQNNEKVLDAYYEKRCADTRRKIVGKIVDKTSSFHYSSSRLFKDLIAEKPQQNLTTEDNSPVIVAPIEDKNNLKKSDKIGEKTLKQQYEDNMAGIATASMIPSAASITLCAAYPVLGYIADSYLATAAQTASYGILSFFCKKRAIDYRRSCKNAARLTLANNSC